MIFGSQQKNICINKIFGISPIKAILKSTENKKCDNNNNDNN